MVARRPSGSPAWMSTNTPEQIVSSRAPCACARRIAARMKGGTRVSAPRQFGMATVPVLDCEIFLRHR
jgi:hypothetical protein